MGFNSGLKGLISLFTEWHYLHKITAKTFSYMLYTVYTDFLYSYLRIAGNLVLDFTLHLQLGKARIHIWA